MLNSLTRQLVAIIAIFLFISTSAVTLVAYLLLRPSVAVFADNVLVLLALSNVIIVLIGSSLAGLFIHNRIAPLWKLTKAARSMGRGDLDTPIQTTARTPEILTLAQTLEKSRRHIAEMMEATRRRHEVQAYFLANMSHEFRTPLSGMKVSIELLLDNARFLSPSELDELLNSLHLSVTSMQSLIDNLLESSRIEAKHFTLRRASAALDPLLAESISVMQPLLKRRAQTLTLDEPLNLPMINLDPTRFVQVMVNLLANASKYSPMSSVIDIIVERHEQNLRVAIADRGQGIPPERQQHIFERFERLEKGAEADYGTGLGLSVVKAIVEGHGGSVGVESRNGGGSTFWFTMPLAS